MWCFTNFSHRNCRHGSENLDAEWFFWYHQSFSVLLSYKNLDFESNRMSLTFSPDSISAIDYYWICPDILGYDGHLNGSHHLEANTNYGSMDQGTSGNLDIVQTDMMVLCKHTKAKHWHSQAPENGVLSLITLVCVIWRVSSLKVRYVARHAEK